MSFREVNDDILKEILEYKDQTEFAYMTKGLVDGARVIMGCLDE